MKKLVAVIALVALLSVAVPAAVGAPSPLAIAKKALRVATGTKKALKRSYSITHPTEIVAVDGGERSAAPFDFAHWEIDCPAHHIAVGTGIGYGALEPVSELSWGTGTIVSLFNPSESSFFSGSVVLNCVWGLNSDLSTARVYQSKSAALAATKRAEADVLAAH